MGAHLKDPDKFCEHGLELCRASHDGVLEAPNCVVHRNVPWGRPHHFDSDGTVCVPAPKPSEAKPERDDKIAELEADSARLEFIIGMLANPLTETVRDFGRYFPNPQLESPETCDWRKRIDTMMKGVR